MDYQSALNYLDEHTSLAGSRAGRFNPDLPVAGQTSALTLEPMEVLLDALGNPHQAYRIVHITGTNGKGSTARYLSSLISATDLSVGTYTSPDVEKINERFSWAGESITDEEFGRIIGLVASVESMVDVSPSRFELLTAAAFVWFAEVAVDVAVIEVGMLGRYDATNVVDADVAVITNIAKDHTDGADGWREAIANEKAGIIKPESHLILGSDFGELTPIFEAEGPAKLWKAEQDFRVVENKLAVGGRLVTIETPNETYDDIFIPFHGAHQGDNLATAVAATEAFFDRAVPREILDFAMSRVALPGRFEVIQSDPIVILDGAHNPGGAEVVRETLDEAFPRLGSWILVVGMLTGKDPVEMLRTFDVTDFDAVICCEPDWSRAIPAEEIAKAAESLGVNPEVAKRPADAYDRALSVAAEEDLVLVSGSIYVVGEVRSAARRRGVDLGD